MTSITTKLVKDGNSVAVRIPKNALEMSGLRGQVRMEIQQGKIILTPFITPRSDWSAQIERTVASNPKALLPDPELIAWEVTANDGIDIEF
jgi:antitoxin component of MazEF toxin-antitoxin module